MITNVQIIPALAKGNLIQWTVDPNTPSDSTFEILRSRDGVSWAPIGTVRGTYFFVDSTFNTKEGFDTNYKLVLNGSSEYVVTSFLGALPKQDRVTIKALRRKEVLLQDKGGGRPGWLLKKRVGAECPLCNGAAGMNSCLSCYGTGYLGGFYDPVVYNTLTVNPQLSHKKKTSPVGTYSSKADVTRGLVYPIIEEGDVWVEKFTDRRYWITGKTEVLYRGIPIIYSKMEMSLVPPLSSIYKIPVGKYQS